MSIEAMKQVQGLSKAPGMAVQARAGETIDELLADEKVLEQLAALIDENQRLRTELKFNTPPAAQRQWVGLTLADREKLRDQFEGWSYPAILVDAVSDILKEKNT